jgi:hypothetical protein
MMKIDKDIYPLIELLNSTPYIQTIFSCSGHSDKGPYLSFQIIGDRLKGLDLLNYLLINTVDSKERLFYIEFGMGSTPNNFAIHPYREVRVEQGNGKFAYRTRSYGEIVEIWKLIEKLTREYIALEKKGKINFNNYEFTLFETTKKEKRQQGWSEEKIRDYAKWHWIDLKGSSRNIVDR